MITSLFTNLNAPVLFPLVCAVSDVKALLAIKSRADNDVPALSSAIPSPQSAPKELIPAKLAVGKHQAPGKAELVAHRFEELEDFKVKAKKSKKADTKGLTTSQVPRHKRKQREAFAAKAQQEVAAKKSKKETAAKNRRIHRSTKLEMTEGYLRPDSAGLDISSEDGLSPVDFIPSVFSGSLLLGLLRGDLLLAASCCALAAKASRCLRL